MTIIRAAAIFVLMVAVACGGGDDDAAPPQVLDANEVVLALADAGLSVEMTVVYT